MLKKLTPANILYAIFIGLIAYMPFHLFLSRWLSLYTGGLGQWDAAKDIVTVVGLGLAVVIAWKHKLFQDKVVLSVFLLSLAYLLLHISFYLFDRKDQDTRPFIVATLFNGRIFAYLFIGIVVAATQKINWYKVLKVVLIVSTVTCIFGLFQYVAAKDLMTHFGYSIERGAKPSFFIDEKPDFPRIMSTVRDPNSYGAYLIVPLVILFVMGLKRLGSTKVVVGLFVLHLAALVLTFSRGAWLGAVIVLGLASVYVAKKQLLLLLRKYAVYIALVFLLAAGVTFALRDSYVVQNVFLHSDKSTVMADPNELRVQLQQDSIKKIVEQPEGYGPGTAGIVSIGNTKTGVVLTENYFLQIAYEVGLVGLWIYLLLLFIIYKRIVMIATKNMKVVMLSSFWAYIFISLLIHLWSNEAVAAQWWLLAGLLIGGGLRNSHNKRVAD